MRRTNEKPNESQFLQQNFNNYVEKYNHDYIFFLRRAGTGYYQCLITAGRILKDFHDLIFFIQSASNLRFEVVPYPFTFRRSGEYYQQFGFNEEEIEKIYGFFSYVKQTYDKEFEECMKESKEFLCQVKYAK